MAMDIFAIQDVEEDKKAIWVFRPQTNVVRRVLVSSLLRS